MPFAPAQHTNVVPGGGGTPPAPTTAGYTITYTGGHWATTGSLGDVSGTSDGSSSISMRTGGGTYLGDAIDVTTGQHTPAYYIPGGPGGASCGGSITAHFAWHGGSANQAAPAAGTVIVTESSSASWSGDSGSCSNGHDGTTSADGTSSSATWYAVAGGASFDVSCDPEASVSSSASGGGSCAVSFSANYSIPTLTFSGVHDSVSDKRLMIGQMLTSTINGGPTDPSITYAWTIGGGSPFIAYSPTNDKADKPTPWISQNSNQTSCYFAKKSDAISVSCTISIGSSSINLADKVGTVAPPFTTNIILAPSTGTLRPDVNSPESLDLWGAVYNSQTWGIFWVGTVTTPSPFDASGKGKWDWVQLITSLTCWYEDSNGTYHDAYENFTSGDPKLDTTYPYGAMYDADGTPNYDSDKPSSPTSGGVQVYADMAFDLYMLYLAPGASLPVPLKKIHWYWNAAATEDISGWKYGSRSQGSSDVSDYPDHPTWSDNVAKHPGYHVRS